MDSSRMSSSLRIPATQGEKVKTMGIHPETLVPRSQKSTVLVTVLDSSKILGNRRKLYQLSTIGIHAENSDTKVTRMHGTDDSL